MSSAVMSSAEDVWLGSTGEGDRVPGVRLLGVNVCSGGWYSGFCLLGLKSAVSSWLWESSTKRDFSMVCFFPDCLLSSTPSVNSLLAPYVFLRS